MTTVDGRYIVNDVDAAITFRPETEELASKVETLAAWFRDGIVSGRGVKPILLDGTSTKPTDFVRPA